MATLGRDYFMDLYHSINNNLHYNEENYKHIKKIYVSQNSPIKHKMIKNPYFYEIFRKLVIIGTGI